MINQPLFQIYRAAAKLLGDMSQVELRINSRDMLHIANNIVFGITRSSDKFSLVFPDGTEFALLNTHIAKALDDVINLPSVELEALADLTTLRETLRKVAKASEAKIRVNINVYGSRATRKDVGRLLSASKVYLQHPDHRRSESKYDNPHVIAFPGMQAPRPNLGPETTPEDVVRGDRPEQFKQAVANVYASLKRSSHLKRLEGDTRVITQLLK
jgi:SWI/SNF-related matrix-associated actin-dependent regulator of chromatin subfamily A3